ncbi:hypothetical protein ACF0H5_018335 [Mactra antiquata]
MDPSKDVSDREVEERLAYFEEKLKAALNPFEATIMKIQSLLVWEKPMKSTVMLAAVHCIFWFFMYSGCRFYSVLSCVIMALFFLRTWKKKIWPEIRVVPKSPDTDEWTPVHPRLLSVPELCKHLATTWCFILHCVNWWTTLRQERPFKFCIETSFIFTCLAIFGHYISDVMLSYIIIMSILMWPCLQYHNLLKKIYMKFEPVFMKLDYSIKVKNKWRYEGDRATVTTNENTDDEGVLTTSVCADNESDLEDFYPQDPMITAALARAITDSEDEGGTPSVSLTPRLSKEPSVANSEDDTNNHVEDTEDNDFALSIDLMPSFEDTLDQTDDELLDLPEPKRESRESSAESMKFIPSHFEESDEETVVHDLPRTDRQRSSKNLSSRQQHQHQPQPIEQLGQDIMRAALTDVVSSAIQNTVMGTFQNLAAMSNPSVATAQERSISPNSDSDDIAIASDHSFGDGPRGRKISEDNSSLNIEDEFDFLEEYEAEGDSKM